MDLETQLLSSSSLTDNENDYDTLSHMVNASRLLPSTTKSSPLSTNQNTYRTESHAINALRGILRNRRVFLPDITNVTYDMGGKYRREMIKSIHGASIAQLAMLVKNQTISTDTRQMVKCILHLHEKVLLANQKYENTFEPEILTNKCENRLQKQLKKESLADWIEMKKRTKKTIQIRYGDYFRQNVEALREATMEDVYGDHKKARRIIATENWKDISQAIKIEEDPELDSTTFGKALLKREVEGRRLERRRNTGKHIRCLARSKTNMNGDTTLFNLHQYAGIDATEMTGSNIYAMGTTWWWIQLAEQIVCDRKWLEANALADEEDVCDKKQILKSILAFQERFFEYIRFRTDDISGELRVQEFTVTQKYREIVDARRKTERMGRKQRFIPEWELED